MSVVPGAVHRNQAELYLETLTGHVQTSVTFQTFPDAGESSVPATILHAPLSDAWDRLLDLQDAGHGVFVMVGEGDGQGRAAKNVRAPRALFVDDDGGAIKTLSVFGDAKPSMVVTSGHGAHFYWLLSAGESLSDFTPAQKALAAKLGTDPAVIDVARVMRLPGLYNLKDRSNPRPVELIQCVCTRRYTIQAVLAALGATVPADPQPSIPKRRILSSATAEDARAYVSTIDAVQGQSGDLHTLRVATALVHKFPTLTREERWTLLREWNEAHAFPAWTEVELGKKLINAERYGRAPVSKKVADAADSVLNPPPAAPSTDPRLDPARYCYDLSSKGRPWRYWHAESWDEGINDNAMLRLLLNSGGLSKRAAQGWQKKVAVVDRCAPVYSSSERIVKADTGELVANTYRRSTLTPETVQAGQEHLGWGPIRQVLTNLAGNDEAAYRFLLGWLAKMVQAARAGRPAKIGTGIVLHGSKGSGKGVLEEVIKAILGPCNVASITQRELASDFNSYLDGCLCVVANEVWSGERGQALLSKLKDGITCHRRWINKKGAAEYERDAVENWLFSSNSHRPVDVERGDRRFSLIRTGGPLPVELGAQVADDARRGGPMVRAFLSYLLALPVSLLVEDYRPLETSAKDTVLRASGNSATKYTLEIGERGFYSTTGPWAGGSTGAGLRTLYVEQDPPTLLRRVLMDAYCAWARQINAPGQQETTLMAALREEFPDLVEIDVLFEGRREPAIRGLPGMLPVEPSPSQRSLAV